MGKRREWEHTETGKTQRGGKTQRLEKHKDWVKHKDYTNTKVLNTQRLGETQTQRLEKSQGMEETALGNLEIWLLNWPSRCDGPTRETKSI